MNYAPTAPDVHCVAAGYERRYKDKTQSMNMHTNPLMAPLETTRLVLRPVVEADLDDVFAILADEVTTADVSWRQSTRESAAAWLERRLAAKRTYGLSFWVIERRSTREVIGLCGFFPQGRSPVELGYVIHAGHWGKGFATEAVTVVMRAALEANVAVYATIRPGNSPSVRVAEKAGLTYRSAIEDERGILLVYANHVSDATFQSRLDSGAA